MQARQANSTEDSGEITADLNDYKIASALLNMQSKLYYAQIFTRQIDGKVLSVQVVKKFLDFYDFFTLDKLTPPPDCGHTTSHISHSGPARWEKSFIAVLRQLRWINTILRPGSAGMW